MGERWISRARDVSAAAGSGAAEVVGRFRGTLRHRDALLAVCDCARVQHIACQFAGSEIARVSNERRVNSI